MVQAGTEASTVRKSTRGESMTSAYAEVPDALLEDLKTVINQHLAPPEVVYVRAEGEEGWDGDPLLNVYIFFEKLDFEEHWPDPAKRARLHFAVDPLLKEAGDTRFPIFTYRLEGEPMQVRA